MNETGSVVCVLLTLLSLLVAYHYDVYYLLISYFHAHIYIHAVVVCTQDAGVDDDL
jgi:hypothetical protein